MELKPGDGRRREAARRGDTDELREPRRHRVSLEHPDDAGRDDEDRRDSGERELKAGVEERVRVPAEEHGRTDEQRLPAVTLAAGEPGERAEAGCERRAHDGRMEPDGERVRRHRGQCRELGNVDSEAEEQDDGYGGAADRGDLEPVHGETVIEACRAEIVEQSLVDAGGPAEDDCLDHIASLAPQARRRVAAEPATDAVADPGDPAAASDDAVRLTAENRVNPLPAQPSRLVEPVRRSRRSLQLADEPEPRALRRRSPQRELEQDGLVHAKVPPAKHERLRPLVERSEPRRLLDLDHGPLGRADPSIKRAAVELGKSHTSPTPGDDYDRGAECRRPKARLRGCKTDRSERDRCTERRNDRRPGEVSKRKAETEIADECMWET